MAAAVQQILLGHLNNYYIFKYVYYHLIEHKNIYSHYPAEYVDSNYSGSLFVFVIASFALLPDWLGLLFWNLFNTVMLFYTIRKLPGSDKIGLSSIDSFLLYRSKMFAKIEVEFQNTNRLLLALLQIKGNYV